MTMATTAGKELRPFRDGLFVGEVGRLDGQRLIGGRCRSCALATFPKCRTCPRCRKFEEQDEVLLGPGGRLYTYAVVLQAPAQFPTPYVIGYVDLDEGVRVFTQIEVDDAADLRLGQRMELTLGEMLAGPSQSPRLVYRFRSAGGT
jgi:uncharacterized OB-fold protein